MKLIKASAWVSVVCLGILACGSDEPPGTSTTSTAAATTGSTGSTSTGGGEGGGGTTSGGGAGSTGTATGGGAGGAGGTGGTGGTGGAASCETVTPGGDVTGNWSATIGEQSYLELAQSDGCVTGQACEAPGKDCYPLQNGTLDGQTLTFFYTFDVYQVNATLTLSNAGGATLTGELFSTKCNCSLPHTYVKQ